MSAFLRSFFARGRPVLSSLILSRRTSLSVNKLRLPGNVYTLVRAASSGSAFRTPVQAEVETEVETDIPIASELPSSGILYEEGERTYLHQVMEAHPSYRDSLFSKQQLQSAVSEMPSDITDLVGREDWSEATNQEIVEAFRLMTGYALSNELQISDAQFNTICAVILSRVTTFEDQEMMEIGKLYCLWRPAPSVKDPNFVLLKNCLDRFCCSRYESKWYIARDFPTILKFADIFYWLRIGSLNHYFRMMIYHSALKVKQPHHMMQLTFYLGFLKNLPRSFKIYDLEKKLFSFKTDYSLNELIIMINSIFRIKAVLQYHPLMEHVLVESLKEFPSVDETTLSTIVKGCINLPEPLIPLLDLIVKKTMERSDDFNLVTLTHVLWASSINNCVNEDFAQLLYDRVMSNMSTLRIKELTRLLTVNSEHLSPNRDIKKFSEMMLVELRCRPQQKWMNERPFIKAATMHRLLMAGASPYDLLDEYFTSDQKDYEALSLDVHLEMFRPDYKGARLNLAQREAFFKHRFQPDSGRFLFSTGQYGRTSNFNRRSIDALHDSLLDIVEGKEDCILFKQLVPSFGYIDVVYCIGKDGTYLPIPNEMRESEPWKITRVPDSNTKNGERFVALTICRSPTEYSTKQIRMLHREKVAILEKLGFNYINMSVEHLTKESRHFKKQCILNSLSAALSNESIL